jgi:EAL domain-containing protein (putative c-di-GMP-specific phosphodiesterase class I)
VFGRVSVNISVAQILDPRFMRSVQQTIDASGIAPDALQLEVTETVFSEDIDRVCAQLSDLRLLGISVAIDDFGAGYSSLAYLARLPVDVLKIDKTFVQALDGGGAAIIGAALSVAHQLKLDVIVEGVETASQLERVRALGATKIQGFVFARPMPASELVGWHAQFRNRHSAVPA